MGAALGGSMPMRSNALPWMFVGVVLWMVGVGGVKADDAAYSLEDFSDLTHCEATASVNFVITGGSGSARASASCEAKVESVNAVVQAMQEWMEAARDSPAEGCAKEKIMTVAEAVGLTVASAYTVATFELDVDGTGSACATAEAEADSYDVVFAKAILQEAVKSSHLSTKDDGLCFTGALSTVFASAWSKAKKSGCVDGPGGFTETQTSFAQAIEQAVARILAEIATHFCVGEEEREEVGKVIRSLSSDGVVTEASAETVLRVVDGMAKASGGSLVQCAGEGAVECCAPSPSKKCDWKPQAGLLWEAGAQHCCCVDGLLPYLHE